MADTEIYLFTGPEAGEKNDAISTIKEMAKKKNGTLDEYSYYANDVRVQDVISQLQNEGLFTAATFVTLRNVEVIKSKDDIELIAAWAKASASSPNTLVLVSDETSVDKKLENAVPSNHRKIFWEMFENRKPQWVRDFFRKNGFSVSDDAVDSILEMVENNTDSLRNECSKFFYCFEKGHQISSEDVDKILTHNREENAFTLFEALSDSSKSQKERFESGLEILQKIRLSKDSSGVALMAGLLYCFRQLRVWHEIHSRGAVGEKELRASGFSSKKNQTKYEMAARIWSSGAVSSIIAELSATDMNIRSTGNTFEDTYLIMLIYSIVMKNGLWPAEYEQDF